MAGTSPGHDAEHVALLDGRALVLRRFIRPPRASGHSIFSATIACRSEVTDEFDLIDIVIKQFNAAILGQEISPTQVAAADQVRDLFMRCD